MLHKSFTFIKQYVRKNTLLTKILISYIVIGMLLLSLLSYVLTNSFSKSTINEININTENMIYQSYNTANLLLTSTYNNFYNLYYKDPRIQNALYGRSFTTIEASEICTILEEQVSSNPIIDSIYIYNKEANLVTTSATTMSNIANFYDADIVKILENFTVTTENIITRRVKFEIYGKSYDCNFISIIFYDLNNDKSISSAMVVNINQKTMQNMVTSSKKDGINQVFILNNKGIVISHSDEKLINSNLINEPVISKILSSTNKQGSLTTEFNGVSSLINYIKFDRFGWTFIGVGAYKNLLSNLETIKNYVTLITILFILIGLVIAALFTNNIYRPLYKLLIEMRSKNENNSKSANMNEYDYLKTTFHNMVDNMTKLKSNINIYSSAKKSELLVQILNGEYYRFINNEILEQCEIQVNSPYYCVAVIKFDSFFKLCNNYGADDISLFKYALQNISQEIIGKEYIIESVDNGLDYISIIINLDTDDISSLDKLKFLLSEIHANAEKYINISITSSIGNIVSNYKSIHHSYLNALAASSYRIIKGKNLIILYDDISDRQQLAIAYPYNIEKQLITYIKQNNEKKLEASLNDFFNELCNSNPDEIMMSTTQLLMIIMRTFKNDDGYDFGNENSNFNELYDDLKKLDTLEEIKLYLSSLFLQIISSKTTSVNNKKQEIVNNILHHLSENYTNPNTSIEIIADYVGLSPNYVRLIFKEVINMSISDYLLKLRIEKAEELLQSTDYTAKEISQLVGYADNRYFYVVFKKCTGKTAEEYRKSFV